MIKSRRPHFVCAAAIAAIVIGCGVPARAASTRQQIYDQAQAAFDAGDWATAIAGFTQVAGPASNLAPSHAQAIMHARLAQAYTMTDNNSAARASAELATRALTDPADATDAALAWSTLGGVYLFDLDMNAAIAAYQHVIASAAVGVALKNNASVGTAIAAMVTDPPRAANALDTVLNDSKYIAALAPMARAQIEDLRGRAELNRGQPQLAMHWFDAAIAHSGGVTGTMVNLVQIGIRGDTAIAYYLLGRQDQLHNFLAHTGAGHLDNSDWIRHAHFDVPVCTADTMRPEDTAVVQFSLDAEGNVIRAEPIYASRPGATGVAFARAIGTWHSNPQDIEKLRPFWRNNIRVQIRCLNRPPVADISEQVGRSADPWLDQINAAHFRNEGLLGKATFQVNAGDVTGIAAMLKQTRELASEGKSDPVLDAQLDAALAAYSAPADVRALVLWFRSFPPKDSTVSRRKFAEGQADRLLALITPFVAAWPNSYGASWLQLEYAIAREKGGQFEMARPALEAVLAASATAVPRDDVLRTVAALHLAMLDRQAGDAAGAAAHIAASGLTSEQCALVDVEPVMTKAAVSGSDFPLEALEWGFDGYVRYAFDIDPDGLVRNSRTVLAYPPFLFNTAAEKASQRFRYLAPTIGGTTVGCSEKLDSIRFEVDKSAKAK
jgi:hypothetical protein